MASVLRRELRLPDFVVTYGSNEFAIVLPETGQAGARQSVMRVRERLAVVPQDGDPRLDHPRFSAGIVTYPHPAVSQTEELYAMAEAALMRGKAQSGSGSGWRCRGGAGQRAGAFPDTSAGCPFPPLPRFPAPRLVKPRRRIQRDLILSPNLEVQVRAVVRILAANRPDDAALADRCPQLDGRGLEVRIDRIVAVAVLDDDGESVGSELSHQPHLSRLHCLHRCPDPAAMPTPFHRMIPPLGRVSRPNL